MFQDVLQSLKEYQELVSEVFDYDDSYSFKHSFKTEEIDYEYEETYLYFDSEGKIEQNYI